MHRQSTLTFNIHIMVDVDVDSDSEEDNIIYGVWVWVRSSTTNAWDAGIQQHTTHPLARNDA